MLKNEFWKRFWVWYQESICPLRVKKLRHSESQSIFIRIDRLDAQMKSSAERSLKETAAALPNCQWHSHPQTFIPCPQIIILYLDRQISGTMEGEVNAIDGPSSKLSSRLQCRWQNAHITSDRGEPAVNGRLTAWVWNRTGWSSSRLLENYRSV